MKTRLTLLTILLLAALGEPAWAAETEQRWTHPNPSEVTGFTLHLRRTPAGEFTEQVDLGLVSHELVGGVATYTKMLDVGELPVWGALRTYNALGESDLSNEKRFAVPEPPQWAGVGAVLMVLWLLSAVGCRR
ncbi:MAG: hypothetical protein V3V08_23475 [Nannocystaceae bacterium]